MKKLMGFVVCVLCVGIMCIGCSPSTETSTPVDGGPNAVDKDDKTATEVNAPAGTIVLNDIDNWDGWYVDNPDWVGSIDEFEQDVEEEEMESGGNALKANAFIGDDRVRDFYIARFIEGVEAGKTYKMSLNYQFDTDTPSGSVDLTDDPYVAEQNFKEKNYIQYIVVDGDVQDQEKLMDLEDYPDHKTAAKYIPAETIGSGEFHPLEVEYTVGEGQSSITFVMIVRFRAEEDAEENWLTFGDFKIEAK
jgi:antirestriction protein